MQSKFLTIFILISFILTCSCDVHNQRYEYYDFNGNRISEMRFNDNGGNGIVKVFFMGENGIKLIDEVEFKNSKKNGRWRRFDENANKLKEGEYKEGMKHGKEIWWYRNGKKLFEVNYKNDKMDGKWIEYYDNSEKFCEIDYKNGKRHGKRIVWDEKGNILLKEIYNEGKLVKKIK